MKGKTQFIIGYSIISILTVIIFALLYYFNVFRRSQQNLHDSLATGYGYYSDPIQGPCTTKTGNCGEPGTQKITKNCVIHPVTGKGCLLPDGTMSYDNLVETVACTKQCVGSAFELSDGLDFKTLRDSDNTLHTIVLGSGGGHLVNKFGIDYTDEFIESFDAVNGTYKVKKCFNDNEYQVYSTVKFSCITGDSDKASNNCIFTCGQDDINPLRMTISNNIGLGIKVPSYPIINNRFVCYDKFGNNQVEAFNTGKIPDDFTYPEVCYEHYYENGNDITFKKIDQASGGQKYYSVDQTLTEYDILYDYNYFQPLTIGSLETMVERIVNLDGQFNIPNDILPYIYLDMENQNYQTDKQFLLVHTFPTPITITQDLDPIGSQYSYLTEDVNILTIPLDFYATGDSYTSEYFHSQNQIIISYDSTAITPVAGNYIYYKINSPYVENFGNIAKIDTVDSVNEIFKVTGNDLGDNAYKYNLRYWLLDNDRFTATIETPGGPDGISPANRIDNNKYFLSDLLIPQDNYFQGLSPIKQILTGDYITGDGAINIPDDVFYVYSTSKKGFYYPVSLEPTYTDSTKFSLPEYGLVEFYLLDGGQENTIYPPDKGLGYKSYEELNGFIEAQLITSSYGNYPNYIKQILPLSTSIKYKLVNIFYIYDSGFDKFYIVNNCSLIQSNTSLIKKATEFLEDIDSKTLVNNSAYVEKMKLYNDISVVKYLDFYNNYGTSFNITISPKKAVVKVADYNVFRSPHILDGKQNICFDQYNRPLQPGTKVQLQPGEELVYYKKSPINADQYKCGFYGDVGGFYTEQDRSKQVPSLGTSAIISKDYLNFYNYLDYLTPGYELEPLYCFDSVQGASVATKNCRDPYITAEFRKATNFYNSGEQLYKNYSQKDLYFSTIKNNIHNPNTPNSWKLIRPQIDYNYIYINDEVYNERNNYIFTYSVTQSGMVGEDLSKLGVYYLYNKTRPIFESRNPGNLTPSNPYNLQRRYHLNNWNPQTGIDAYGQQALAICNLGTSTNYIYNFGLSVLGNNGSSLYNFELFLGTQNTFGVCDYVNPDFNLFNSFFTTDGISAFTFDYPGGCFEFTQGVSVFTDVEIRTVAKDDLVVIAYDNTVDFLSNFKSFNGDENYNYSFEVCKVLDFNKTNKTVNLERNLLNYPLANRYYGEGVSFTAYLLDPNFKTDLLFPITKVIGTNVYFNFSAYFMNPPETNDIYSNCQARTVMSTRIIKNNIEIPNSQISPQNFLYLLSSPEENKVSSYLNNILKIGISGGYFAYYFNGFKNNLYGDNGNEIIFESGDTINLEFPSGSTYQLPILGTKNTFGLSVFDYFSAANVDITELSSNSVLYGVSYINFTTTNEPSFTSYLEQTINPYLVDRIQVNDNGTLNNIGPSNYTTQYYQNIPDSVSYSYYVTSFDSMFSQQKNLDTTNNMIKMTLKSTRLYNDLDNPNSYLTIDNIICNEKPYGPTYLTDLASDNNLNFSGYGTITKFDFTGNYLKPSTIYADMILQSRSGFFFSVASEISQFQFNTALRKSDNIPPNYDFNTTYDLNELAYYSNEKKLIYTNTNDIVSQFTSDGNAEYDQPYYILKDGIYTYPLYLDSATNRVSVPYPENTFYKLWYDVGASINSADKPNNNIYKAFSLDGLSIKSTWKQIPESIFPIDGVTDFITNNYYEANSVVQHNDEIWLATDDNFNLEPSRGSSFWKLYDSYGELYNKSGYFYNINTGTSTIGVSLTLPMERDINNYPLSIIDYSQDKKYTLFTEVLEVLDYNDKLNQSDNFLSLFDSVQTDILGQILLFKQNSSIISLAASPVSKEDIPYYNFLKQSSLYQKGDILSQYLYNINLPSQEYMGKPFCSGNVPYNSSQTVTNYEFTNSVAFLPIPVDIDYQDYPFIVFKEGKSIYDLPPNAIYAQPGGMSPINTIIKGVDGTYRRQVINFKRSYTKTFLVDDMDNFDSYQTGTVAFINDSFDGPSYNYQFTGSKEYYNFVTIIPTEPNPTNITDSDVFTNNRPWKLINNETNKECASGMLFFPQNEINAVIDFQGNNLIVNVTKENLADKFNNSIYIGDKYEQLYTLGLVKNDLELSGNTATKQDGFYLLNSSDKHVILSKMYLCFDDNQKFIPFDKIYIDTTGLTDGEKIYFVGIDAGVSDLKTKMYGFFENQYLSPIVYQGTSLIEDNNSIELPCMIFSPFSNNLLEPDYKLELLDNDGYKVTSTTYDREEFSDVFILGVSSNGISLSLTTNYYKYPIFNTATAVSTVNLNNVLIFEESKNLGVINTNSVTKFVSSQFYINDYITLGGISDIIPSSSGDYSSNDQYYRETKGAINYNTSTLLNCSIYQSDRIQDYPNGVNINSYIEDDKNLFSIQFGLSGSSYLVKTTPQIIYNTTNVISQADQSNNNNPIYIGISGGDQFAGSIINDSYNFDSNSGVIVKYYLNNTGVSGKTYHDLSLVNNFNNFIVRDITVAVYKNDLFAALPNRTLYLGTSTSKGLTQFSGGISTLVFEDF